MVLSYIIKDNIGLLVRPRLHQIDLSAALFFGRGPQKLNMAGNSKLANGKCKGQKAGNAGNCNEIVTTCMSNSGECVILGVEVHTVTISIACFGLKSGAGNVGVARCLDTLGLEEVADGVVGNVFLVRLFRIFVNLCFIVRKNIFEYS